MDKEKDKYIVALIIFVLGVLLGFVIGYTSESEMEKCVSYAKELELYEFLGEEGYLRLCSGDGFFN